MNPAIIEIAYTHNITHTFTKVFFIISVQSAILRQNFPHKLFRELQLRSEISSSLLLSDLCNDRTIHTKALSLD